MNRLKGGIFSGIFASMVDALITPDEALAALGAPFVRQFTTALSKTREDYAAFLGTLPSGWHPHWTERTLAGVIHDRLWVNLTSDIEEAVPGVTMKDDGTTRSLCIDERIVLRVKRHSAEGQISGYRTRGSADFYMGALAGLEMENLAVGYEWLRETREIGRPVLSKQKTTNADPIWVVSMQEPQAGARELPYEPIIPPQPQFDLRDIIGAEVEEANGA